MINTGETVLKENGVLPSCTNRQGLCGFACCQFTVGNWIMLLPGEYDESVRKGLRLEHLSIEDKRQAVCHTPCQRGDLKPLDCSWYPLFPANRQATMFLVADHRKCPIPNRELIDKMFSVHVSALAWERLHPGSLEKMVVLSRNFVGYMPYPYKIENGMAVDMNEQELQEIALPSNLSDDYRCKQWTEIKPGYNATTTPDDE